MTDASVAFSSLDYLKRRAHALRQGLHQRLEEIYFADFPIASPQVLITLIQDILRETKEEIDKSTDERSLAVICRLIQHLGSWLKYVDHAHTAQTPRGLVELLVWMLETISPDSQAVVWPQAEYNYTIWDVLNGQDGIRKLIENALPQDRQSALLSKFKGPLNLISFPRIERDDILLHAVFGHELGHPIADEFLAAEQSGTDYAQGLATVSAAVGKLAPRYANSTKPAEILRTQRKLLDMVLVLRIRALQELISDYVGVLCFGPSALFSMHEIFLSSSLDTLPKSPAYYPPPRYRLRLTLKACKDLGFEETISKLVSSAGQEDIGKAARGLLGQADKITSITTDLNAISADALMKLVFDWVDGTINQAFDHARKRLTAIIYTAQLADAELPELLQRLQIGVPPNEIGDAGAPKVVDPRSAILAGWLVKICGKKKSARGPVPLVDEDFARLRDFVLRAIEFIRLQKRHQAHLTAQKGA